MDTDQQNRPGTDAGSDSRNPGQSHFDREFAGLTDPAHYSKDAISPGGLSAAESSPEDANGAGVPSIQDKLGKGFTDSLQSGGVKGLAASGVLKILSGQSRKKKAATGGVVGTIVTLIIVGAGLSSGPLEFAHIAQLLHGAHFSQQENAGDGRMGRLYRFLRPGGSIGETRLGALGSRYHAKIIADLHSIGITPEYAAGDVYKGMTIDTEHEGSPYKGKTPEEAAKIFEEKSGIKPTVEGGKLKVDANKFFKQRKSLGVALGELGTSKVTTATRIRVLSKFGLVSWHPLKKVDKKLNSTVAERYKKFKEEREKNLKSKIPENLVDPTHAQLSDGAVGADGKPVPPTDIPSERPVITPDATSSS